MTALELMKARRAFIAGAAAQKAGLPQVVPSKMGDYALNWRLGWEGASVAAHDLAVQARTGPDVIADETPDDPDASEGK